MRKTGGVSGQGQTGLPQSMKDMIAESWAEIVKGRLGFESLEQMQAARAAELQRAAL